MAAQYYLVLAFLLLTLLVMHRLVYSLLGLSFMAIRNNEVLAEAVGVNTFAGKVLSFVVANFFAGLAGGIFASLMGSISPSTAALELTFDWLVSPPGRSGDPGRPDYRGFCHSRPHGVSAVLGRVPPDYFRCPADRGNHLFPPGADGRIQYLAAKGAGLLRAKEERDSVLLEVKNLTKNFAGLTAVNNVSLHVREGEISGHRRTQWGREIGSLRADQRPAAPDLRANPPAGRRDYRLEAAPDRSPRASPGPFRPHALFDQLRVVDNLAIGHRLRTTGGFWSTLLHTRPWEEDKERTTAQVMETLNFIGLAEKAFHFVSTLSQAEQKRLSIGVALISRPKMILLDEPTGGLILEDTDEITDLIKKIYR